MTMKKYQIMYAQNNFKKRKEENRRETLTTISYKTYCVSYLQGDVFYTII